MQLGKHLDFLEVALEEFRTKQKLDFSMLMVTDVVRGSSRLLMSDAPYILDELPYQQQPDGTRHASGMVSRKKQLLPIILGLLES